MVVIFENVCCYYFVLFFVFGLSYFVFGLSYFVFVFVIMLFCFVLFLFGLGGCGGGCGGKKTGQNVNIFLSRI